MDRIAGEYIDEFAKDNKNGLISIIDIVDSAASTHFAKPRCNQRHLALHLV